MKQTYIITWIIILLSCIKSIHCNRKDYTMTMTSEWKDLEKNLTKNEKWVLAGNITFKKKAKEPVALEEITLIWNGPFLNHVNGSLYQKDPYKIFMPIEKYWIADSVWNTKTQQLIFRFNKKMQLEPLSIFAFTLIIPQQMEDTLKKGYFTLHKDHLPKPYQTLAQHCSLDFVST